MRVVSTACALLLGCRAHLGVAPAATSYRSVEVTAAVAEPQVGVDVRTAVSAALAARSALDASGEPLQVEVLTASLLPSARLGGVLLYRATVRVRFQAGDRSHEIAVERDVADPGSAASAGRVRPELLRELVDEVAAAGVAWAVAVPAEAAPR